MHTATAIVCAYASLQDTLQFSPFGGGGHERRAFTKCLLHNEWWRRPRMSPRFLFYPTFFATTTDVLLWPVDSHTPELTQCRTLGAQERSYKVHLATKGIQIRFRHHYLTLLNFFSCWICVHYLFTSYSTEGLSVVAGCFFPSQQDGCV